MGPLKGAQLELVDHDQITFALWKAENPNGRVLKPDAEGNMAEADWEDYIQAFPTVTELAPDSPLGHRTVIFGLMLDGVTKAYPRSIILKTSPVLDTVGETPVVLVFAKDGLSARVFDRRLDGQTLDLFAKPESETMVLVDTQTGSEWDFTGTAISGPLQGKSLTKVPLYIDYWFDWVEYHPEATLETFGMPIEDEASEEAGSEADSEGEKEPVDRPEDADDGQDAASEGEKD